MALWIAKNKRTGKEYPNFTDEEKAAYLADPILSGKYTFTVMPGSDKARAPEPLEARKVDTAKPKE